MKEDDAITAWPGYAAVHAALLVAVWSPIQPLAARLTMLCLGFAIVVVTHVLIDWLKIRLSPGGERAALGLVLAAKSVFRFEDLCKGRRHAKYYLIWTLTS